ncbi:MAG: HEAT repeat domain-containing protein [Gammaproteobacteria bacterium]|nr:HEAT repeat domain-containing protein [Gammaproteobacteria bacterium]
MQNEFSNSQNKPASLSGPFRTLLAAVGFALSIAIPAVYAAGEADLIDPATDPEDAVSIDYQNGRLSLSAEQAPIVELMQLVADEAGFEAAAYGDFGAQTVSLTFTELPLAVAIRRLLKDTSAIVSYRRAGEPGAERAIEKIFLLGSGSAAGSEPIRLETLAPDPDNDLRSSEIEATDARERIDAIERTQGLGDEITLENLAFSLQHDPDPEVRLKAITAIGEIGGSTAAAMLESGLGDDNPRVRQLVVQTLGAIEDERIPFWLGQVLMGDPDPRVRLVAVHSIARQGGDTARIFLEAATGDSSSAVSDAALGLLR